MATGSRLLAHGSWLLALLLLAVGCGPTPQQLRVDSAIQSYYAGDYDAASERLLPLAEKTDQDFVLNNLRLGSALLHGYRLDDAEASLLKAYEVINSTGVNDGGRTLGAVLVDEKIKVWKGEPYERAMANFYLGLVYYIQQDYANARGAFENALFKLRDYAEDDTAVKDDYREVESNFAVASLMLGKCWQRLGREDLARANFQRAVQVRPNLADVADYDRNMKSNMLLVIELGRAPKKVAEFDGSIVTFSPTIAQAGPLPPARVTVHNGTTVQAGPIPPAVDLVATAWDRRWQSIDTIRAVKSAVGTGLLAAGAFEAMRGAGNSGSAQRRDLTAAAVLIGAGLLLKATSQADLRQWEMLPRALYVVPLSVPPGKHDVTVDFPGAPGLSSRWIGLEAPSEGQATYIMRVQRYNPGPFYWRSPRDIPPLPVVDTEANDDAGAVPAPRKTRREQRGEPGSSPGTTTPPTAPGA